MASSGICGNVAFLKSTVSFRSLVPYLCVFLECLLTFACTHMSPGSKDDNLLFREGVILNILLTATQNKSLWTTKAHVQMIPICIFSPITFDRHYRYHTDFDPGQLSHKILSEIYFEKETKSGKLVLWTHIGFISKYLCKQQAFLYAQVCKGAPFLQIASFCWCHLHHTQSQSSGSLIP